MILESKRACKFAEPSLVLAKHHGAKVGLLLRTWAAPWAQVANKCLINQMVGAGQSSPERRGVKKDGNQPEAEKRCFTLVKS
jgi:hypothetical protein